ncbi:hypothetical protein JMUB7552_27650 [Staphylococcus aureus]
MYKIHFFKQKPAYEIAQCLVGSEMCIRDRVFGPIEEVVLYAFLSVSYTHLTLPTTPYV